MLFNVAMDTLKHYVSQHGLSTLAASLGISAQRLSNWIKRGNVPDKLCGRLEEATKGAVMRWDLRPDDWHEIWPELKRRKDAPAIKKVEAA